MTDKKTWVKPELTIKNKRDRVILTRDEIDRRIEIVKAGRLRNFPKSFDEIASSLNTTRVNLYGFLSRHAPEFLRSSNK
jgi:hypothetical protein